MNLVIPLIGYGEELEPFCYSVEDELKIKIDKSPRLADQALEMIAQKEFPLILINDTLAAGNLILPHNTVIDDYPQIAQYCISQIRLSKDNAATPIVALLYPMKEYVEIRDYRAVGATHCIDMCKTSRVENINIIKKYLPTAL